MESRWLRPIWEMRRCMKPSECYLAVRYRFSEVFRVKTCEKCARTSAKKREPFCDRPPRARPVPCRSLTSIRRKNFPRTLVELRCPPQQGPCGAWQTLSAEHREIYLLRTCF